MGAQGAAPRPEQRIILITGSTDGLGREVARRLGDAGAHVIVHGRNRARGDSVVASIIETGRGTARFYAADFASLGAVRAMADSIKRDYQRIDVIVNNAGIARSGNDPRAVSADGYELHFAVNYLAGVALTRALLPLLPDGGRARVVNVASMGQAPIDFTNVMLEGTYTSGRGYAQSKLAQIMFSFDLARELAPKGAIVSALHPATYMNTTMVRTLGVTPASSVSEGADAVVHLITGTIPTGEYFNGLRAARANAQAYDERARALLRALTDSLLKR